MTQTLTTEELRQIVETDHVQCGDAAAMARELLANREAQPVAWAVFADNGNIRIWSTDRGITENVGLPVPLYTAPPAPAVNAAPDFEAWFVEKYKQPERLFKNEDGGYKFSGVQMAFSAWSDGRAAMLAQPVRRGCTVVPLGWMDCAFRLPEQKPGSKEYLVYETLNNRVQHDYWNVEDGSTPEFTPFWNHYGGYVTHWMPLPAAPEGGNG